MQRRPQFDGEALRPLSLALSALICALLLTTLTPAAQDTTGGALLLTPNAAQDQLLLIDPAPDGGEIVAAFSLAPGVHTAWGFSPDGCRLLATVTTRDGLSRAYTARLDGSDARELVSYEALPRSQWGVWEPTWSPAGDKIAFTLIRDGFEDYTERAYHIGWVTPDGGEPAFYSVTGREHTPVWSPDGLRLAYVSYDERAPGETFNATAVPEVATATPPDALLKEADLWVVGTDGEDKYRATAFETGSVRAPRWSPSGEWLSFVHAPSNNNDTLWAVSAQAGARPIQVTYAYNLTLDHTWLPDSSALLASARSINQTDTAYLWTFPPRSGADADAAQYLPEAGLVFPDYPTFHADGQTLALRSGYRAVVQRADGTSTVLDGAEGNMPLYWTPDGFISIENCLD